MERPSAIACDGQMLRHREIGYLLGDPQRPGGIAIEEWASATEQARSEQYDLQLTGERSLLDMYFEPACALLHDSRPRAARELFQSILIPEHRPSVARVLALLGNGRTLNVWRRYAAADASLSKALND